MFDKVCPSMMKCRYWVSCLLQRVTASDIPLHWVLQNMSPLKTKFKFTACPTNARCPFLKWLWPTWRPLELIISLKRFANCIGPTRYNQKHEHCWLVMFGSRNNLRNSSIFDLNHYWMTYGLICYGNAKEDQELQWAKPSIAQMTMNELCDAPSWDEISSTWTFQDVPQGNPTRRLFPE